MPARGSLARLARRAAAALLATVVILAALVLLSPRVSLAPPLARPPVVGPAATGAPTVGPSATGAPVGPIPADGAPLASGSELFTRMCAECHGAAPEQLGRLADASWIEQRGDEALARSIAIGRSLPGARDAMPAFGRERAGPLEPEGVRALVVYLRSLAGLPPVAPSPTPRPTTMDPAALARATELFATSCASCHGERGDGIISARLTDSSWLRWRGDAALARSIAEGKGEMRAFGIEFGGRLTAADIAALIAYLRSLAEAP